MTKRVSLTPGPSAKFDLAVPSRSGEFSRYLSRESLTFGSEKSLTRFNAPVMIWERTTTGYRITDLRHHDISSTHNLIHSNFFLEEPLCLATSLSKDIDSLKSYRRFLQKCMSEENSVCAIHEGNGSIVGLAIMSLRHKTDQDDRDTTGTALAAILTLKNHLFIRAKVNDTISNLEKYFRIEALCVSSDHRGKSICTGLLRSCVAKSRSVGVSACIGIFSSNNSQRIAARLGFEKLDEVPYSIYIEEISPDNPFAEIAQENYSLACMAVKTNGNSTSNLQESSIRRFASEKRTKN